MNTKIRLTQRESEVLTGISHGRTTKEIAHTLFLSDHTIVSYRKILLDKLNAANAADLVRRGFEHGYLTLGEGST